MAQRLIQAYQQAPWRLSIQRLGTFLLVLVMFGLVTGMYLYISGQAAVNGLEFQEGESYRKDLFFEIASLKTEYSRQTSISVMMDRATKAGYKPTTPGSGLYISVPNYTGKPAFNPAPPFGSDMVPEPVLKPSYTQSLWEWLFEAASGMKLAHGGN